MSLSLGKKYIVALFLAVPVGCWCFEKRLSPHFEVMSPVSKTPWKASTKFSAFCNKEPDMAPWGGGTQV